MASTMQDYRTSRELPTLDEFRSANGPLMLGGILALIEREQKHMEQWNPIAIMETIVDSVRAYDKARG